MPENSMSHTTPPNHIRMACIALGDKLFAVDIMRIREIIIPQEIAPLPFDAELLDGVINLRGSVIPVMSLRKRFGMMPREDRGESRLLIVSLVKRVLALEVDDVMEVVSVPVADLKPPVRDASGAGALFLLGVCLWNGRILMILDIDSLLSSPNVFRL
jgi:purine-binding chemotaxis protein CheW